jgi:hypothetical protein
MDLLSTDSLDFEMAWRRLLFRMRRVIDVQDRLPLEVVDRLFEGSPTVPSDHHLSAVITVMGTKGSGTVRPFARVAAQGTAAVARELAEAEVVDVEEEDVGALCLVNSALHRFAAL